MGSPVKPLLCVFSTIKLNCDVVEKLEQCPVQQLEQQQQQTVPYCPTFGQKHTDTECGLEKGGWFGKWWGGLGKKCSSEQLFSAYHLVKRIRFTLPCGSDSSFRPPPSICISVCASVYKSTNLLPTAKLREDRQLYPLSAHNFCMS